MNIHLGSAKSISFERRKAGCCYAKNYAAAQMVQNHGSPAKAKKIAGCSSSATPRCRSEMQAAFEPYLTGESRLDRDADHSG
jgi:hypothetical protein